MLHAPDDCYPDNEMYHRYADNEKEFIQKLMTAEEWDQSYSGIKIRGNTSHIDLDRYGPELTNKIYTDSFQKYLTEIVPNEGKKVFEIFEDLGKCFSTLNDIHYYRRNRRGNENLTTHYLYIKTSNCLTCLFYTST